MPLTLLGASNGVTDVRATYDAAGRLHACGLRSNGDVVYWRVGTSGAVEQNLVAMTGGYGGCGIATKQYGTVEGPVIVTWRANASGWYGVAEVHSTVATDPPNFAASPTWTNVNTPSGQASGTLTPPAITRYLGIPATANERLMVAGATNVGVRFTTQAAGSTSWPSLLYVSTLSADPDVAPENAIAVAMATDVNGGANRLSIAVVWEHDYQGVINNIPVGYTHQFELFARNESNGLSQPYGRGPAGSGPYEGRTISVAANGGSPYIGATEYAERYLNQQGAIAWQVFPVVFEPHSEGWDMREVAYRVDDTRVGDYVETHFVNGVLTASYLNEQYDQRIFATFETFRPGCVFETEADCWYRNPLLVDAATPVAGREALATASATSEAATFLVMQNQALSGSSYSGAVMGMTTRVNQLTCSGTFPHIGSDSYGPPKIVGSGSTWFAVYKTMNGLNSGLEVREWDETAMDGVTWSTPWTLAANALFGVGDFDAAFDGSKLQVAWATGSGATINRRSKAKGVAPELLVTVDTGATAGTVVRLAAAGARYGIAYAKAGNINYVEYNGPGPTAVHVALDDSSYSYRIKSVGLALDPSDNDRRIVGVLSNGTLKTATCTGVNCSSSTHWGAASSLGLPNAGAGSAWLDQRFGVAYAPNGGKSAIVGGGTATAQNGFSRLYLHEDGGSGFGATATEIDDGHVFGSYTVSGLWADVAYDANGNWQAVHFDTTSDQVRSIKQWIPDIGGAYDRRIWSAPGGLMEEVRMGGDAGRSGFGLFGVRDTSGTDTRTFCEPAVL